MVQALLEHRDLALDRGALADRLEYFRDRVPDRSTPLLLEPCQHNEDVAPTAGCIPEVDATELTASTLHTAIATHGALLVRNFLPADAAQAFTPTIDSLLEACEQHARGEPCAGHRVFSPPDNLASIMPNRERELGNTRGFHRDSGSAMCVEAPSVAEALLEWYEHLGLKQMLHEYFGEAPCLSAKKWVLRRSKLPVSEAGWHQDGAFMGTDINSLNMWLPLSHCGADSGAPGLDVLPRRLYDISSADGAQFEWSVSSEQVRQEAASNTVASPEFNPGDAYFFDHLFLHRTQYGPDFSRLRYAIETWFFGVSRFPKNQIPLAW